MQLTALGGEYVETLRDSIGLSNRGASFQRLLHVYVPGGCSLPRGPSTDCSIYTYILISTIPAADCVVSTHLLFSGRLHGLVVWTMEI